MCGKGWARCNQRRLAMTSVRVSVAGASVTTESLIDASNRHTGLRFRGGLEEERLVEPAFFQTGAPAACAAVWHIAADQDQAVEDVSKGVDLLPVLGGGHPVVLSLG